MIAPVRSGAGLALRSSTASTSVARTCLAVPAARRTLILKEERWTQQTIKNATESNLIPDESGKGGMDLSTIVPNIEARWGNMSREEQYGVYRQLEALQRKDWKELSLDEKKAAYYVSFGPHGPRKPITKPGQGMRTAMGVTALIGVTFVMFFGVRRFAHEPPKTMTTEYQEQMNERARESKQNPISGISSENYKGKGHVQKMYA